METKSKRFSFAGFSSRISRSLSFAGSKTTLEEIKEQPHTEDNTRTKRNLKSQSLYIKAFKRPDIKINREKKSFDVSEAHQSNREEVRGAIQKSLSAVIYASPQTTSGQGASKLVPILVTSDLSESVGGILLADSVKTEEVKPKKKKTVEYDNTLEIYRNKSNGNQCVVISWQGYGYKLKQETTQEIFSELLEDRNMSDEETVESLLTAYDKDVWDQYRGLIHPLHLFRENDSHVEGSGKWSGLTVSECIQYYDNYGSMMLKIREARMKQQQLHYINNIVDINKECIIPNINKVILT